MQGVHVFVCLFWRAAEINLMCCKDVTSHCHNYSTHFLPQPLHLYEALAFLARGDVFSSDLTTPLAAPPDKDRFVETLWIQCSYMQIQDLSQPQRVVKNMFANLPFAVSLLGSLLFGLTVFFFAAWLWLCSLHFFSWKLMNFHIIQACVRQMAARQVILRGKIQFSKALFV